MSSEEYNIQAEVLLRVNGGENPNLLARYAIPALESGRSETPDGVKEHTIDSRYVPYGLVLALAERIRNGEDDEREYIRTQLHELIGELDK